MAKLDQSVVEVEKLLTQIQGIADNVKKAHAFMVGSGAPIIEIDIATAIRYLDWLEEWGEKVKSAGRRAAKKKEGEDAHATYQPTKRPTPKMK